MGYVVGANPFGQMIFSPLIGWWGNRVVSIRLPLMFSLIIFILSSACYSMLEIFSSHHKYWMLGARFFVGVSSGWYHFIVFYCH
jgi:ceroid-lipofuscinosis MFS transporter 7